MGESDDIILKVSNLNVEMQKQIILGNLNFEIPRGSNVAIVGPNGAGKTMLFRTLLNLIPYRGKIQWNGKVKIGYVPQNISVKDIPISVEEFLAYRDGSDVAEALSAVRLGEKGFHNRSLNVLSGGQLRRVLIAWALIDNPNVLLLDEPTVGVDIGSEESIFVMLNELRKRTNITMLLITHDIHLVKEYTELLLGLNKCMTYFGDAKQIAEPLLQQRIYGETICLGP